MRVNTKQYYIAVDGGATKTEFCVRNIATKEDVYFTSGSTNYKNAGTDVEKNLIHDGINHILEALSIKPDQVKGLTMGLSGCDSPNDFAFYMNVMDMTGIDSKRIYITNDCELAFFSEGKPPGMSIVAGTGSIATGISADYRKARSGGWGSPIGDEGSGGWIGISVIRDLLRYCDGYGEYRPVYDVIRTHMNKSGFDILPAALSLYGIEELAGFAKLIMDEAERGDDYCASLTGKSAELVAEIANSVYRKLGFINESVVDVVMLGSLFKSQFFCTAFKESLIAMTGKDNFDFCGQVKKPVLGGIEYAYYMWG